MKKLDVPPIWTLGAWVLALVLSRVLPSPGWDSLGLRWLGLFWIVLAVLYLLWAALWFRRKKTPIHPGHRPDALITEGPFRISRNPIYLSMVVASLGFVLYLGAAVGLLVVAGLWWVLDRRFAAPEEQRLIEVFGDAGRDYVANVRRWV